MSETSSIQQAAERLAPTIDRLNDEARAAGNPDRAAIVANPGVGIAIKAPATHEARDTLKTRCETIAADHGLDLGIEAGIAFDEFNLTA